MTVDGLRTWSDRRHSDPWIDRRRWEVSLSVESSAGSLTEEPTLQFESEGVIHQANDTALALPGLSFDVVRALPRVSFATGPTDLKQRLGLAIHREDSGGFTVTLTSASGSPAAPSKVVSVGDVLGLWRAAERVLETIDVGSPEYESAIADITEVRAEYQRLFEARLRDA